MTFIILVTNKNMVQSRCSVLQMEYVALEKIYWMLILRTYKGEEASLFDPTNECFGWRFVNSSGFKFP